MNLPDRLLLTPLNKLLNNLTELQSQQDFSSKIPLVFLLTGALNPIHHGHIHLFRIAKKTIENNYEYNKRFMVIAGFISPSQERYVQQKLGHQAISVQHRIKMAKLAIEDDVDKWVEVDEWEANLVDSTGFIDFWEVTEHLEKWLNYQCPQVKQKMGSNPNNIRVIYLCGSDHFINKGLKDLVDNGVFVVGREDPQQNVSCAPSWIEQCQQKLSIQCNGDICNHFVILVEGEDNYIGISSTKIRNRKTQMELNTMCSKNIVQYIQDNNLFDH